MRKHILMSPPNWYLQPKLCSPVSDLNIHFVFWNLHLIVHKHLHLRLRYSYLGTTGLFSELMQKETRKLSCLFISPCPSLLMVTPGTLIFWNFWSDYMCSAAQLTLWPENGHRQRDRKLSSHASLFAGNFNGRPRGCKWINGSVTHLKATFPKLISRS